MTHSFYSRVSLFFSAAASLSACQTGGAPTPATLAAADPQTIAVVKQTLAMALDRARIELGPGDPTKTPSLSVLPPPLSSGEDRSMARPTHFDIVLKGARCFIVRRETGREYALDGVSCTAYKN